MTTKLDSWRLAHAAMADTDEALYNALTTLMIKANTYPEFAGVIHNKHAVSLRFVLGCSVSDIMFSFSELPTLVNLQGCIEFKLNRAIEQLKRERRQRPNIMGLQHAESKNVG